MKRVIYTKPNGLLAVLVPTEGARLAYYITLADGTVIPEGADKEDRPQAFSVDQFLKRWPVQGAVAAWAESEELFVARIAAKDVPAGLTYNIVDESAIPTDRTFRNAWVACPVAGCRIDMSKARELWRAEMRRMRAPQLVALDVAYMRADEANDTAIKASIATQKKELRDVTRDVAIEAAQTPEDLRRVWPTCLGARL